MAPSAGEHVAGRTTQSTALGDLALLAKIGHALSMLGKNKDGQELGRKGAESRARLLGAVRKLVDEAPSGKLTATAIAREAGLASQTFYLYFAGVDEALLYLSRDASEDTAEITAELDATWAEDALRFHTGRVVDAFYRHWDRHRAILHIRNFRADGGEQAFVEVRSASSLPLVTRIATRILAAHGSDRLTETDALARAVIIFSAIERMAARYASLSDWRSSFGSEDLKRAEADILALLISPAESAKT
jgi:AcrR family transcriptional regulator